MDRLLIIGDSFAADWSKKTSVIGWPVKMAHRYQTTNLAQAGCGQYKIYKQLHSVDYRKFDNIIIWHTSPYRVHVLQNPIHQGDVLHHNADLIYSDVEYHATTDQSLQPILEWFNLYFDLEHADFVYSLICDRLLADLSGFPGKVIHCVCQQSVYEKLHQQENFLNFNHLFSRQSEKPKSNHFDQHGNDQIYLAIQKMLG